MSRTAGFPVVVTSYEVGGVFLIKLKSRARCVPLRYVLKSMCCVRCVCFVCVLCVCFVCLVRVRFVCVLFVFCVFCVSLCVLLCVLCMFLGFVCVLCVCVYFVFAVPCGSAAVDGCCTLDRVLVNRSVSDGVVVVVGGVVVLIVGERG